VGGGTGGGTFSATLTHAPSCFGYCVTYKATVVGTVGLIF